MLDTNHLIPPPPWIRGIHRAWKRILKATEDDVATHARNKNLPVIVPCMCFCYPIRLQPPHIQVTRESLTRGNLLYKLLLVYRGENVTHVWTLAQSTLQCNDCTLYPLYRVSLSELPLHVVLYYAMQLFLLQVFFHPIHHTPVNPQQAQHWMDGCSLQGSSRVKQPQSLGCCRPSYHLENRAKLVWQMEVWFRKDKALVRDH